MESISILHSIQTTLGDALEDPALYVRRINFKLLLEMFN